MATIQLSKGATETDINKALSTLASGDTLRLAAGETVNVSTGIRIDVSKKDITFDLNGSTLQQAGDVNVILASGNHPSLKAAAFTASAKGTTAISFDGSATLKAGDFVKIVADDVLPNDQGGGTRLGQALEVASVKNGVVTLKGELLYRDNYTTNIRATAYNSGDLVIKNGVVQGDQSHSTWVKDLVHVRSTVDAKVDHLTVQNGNSMGINIVDSVNAHVVDATVKNLRDDPSKGWLGYAVHSSTSVGTTVQGLYAEAVRHATDSNTIDIAPNQVDAAKYGADIGMLTIGTIAYETTAISYSTHTESRNSTVTGSMAFDTPGLAGSRGVGNEVRDSFGVNTVRGIQLYEYGDGDGYGFTYDGIRVKEATLAFSVVNAPHSNVISNSVIQVLGNANTPGLAASLVNTSVLANMKLFDESMTGSANADVLLGGKGSDTISGGAGADYIWGGMGVDLLSGGTGRDYFAFHRLTDAGDTIRDFAAGNGGDYLDVSVLAKHYGWAATDPLASHLRFVQSGADTKVQVDVDGGGNSFVDLVTLSGVKAAAMNAGNVLFDLPWEAFSKAATSSSVTSVAVDNALNAAATIAAAKTVAVASIVSTLADPILGSLGAEKLSGSTGDDLFIGGRGADTYLGGDGEDGVTYASVSGGLTLDLLNPSLNTGAAKGAIYNKIENLEGTAFADTIRGNDAVNLLIGGDGDDRIEGRSGSDTLIGGNGHDFLIGGDKSDTLEGGTGNDRLEGDSGYDLLTGGLGADQFLFVDARHEADIISDFSRAQGDKIVFASTAFGGLNAGTIASHLFTGTAPAALSAGAAFLFNTNTGQLSYDADGSGSKAAVLIATLDNLHQLAADDFSFL